MKRGIGYRPSRAKSVLFKSSWAVVIEWVCGRGLGFDRDIILLLHLSNRRTWLRWYVYSPFVGDSLPSAPFHHWYVNRKNKAYYQGQTARITLDNMLVLFYNNDKVFEGRKGPSSP